MRFLTIFYRDMIQQYLTVTAPHSIFKKKNKKQIKYQMLGPISQRDLSPDLGLNLRLWS